MKNAILILALILSLFFISGCMNTEQDNLDKIRYIEIKVYDPVYIAQEKGFFLEENLTVDFVGELYGGPEMIQALASNSADAATTSTIALINARKNGISIKGVWDMQTSTYQNPIHTWIALKSSNITSVNDLRNKKIGVNTLGSAFHYMTLEYLKQNNISENDVKFVVIPHPHMEQSLLSGQIDVAGMVTPYNEFLLQKNNNSVVLFNTNDIFGENMQSVIGIFSDRYIAENPENVKKFFEAYKKAIIFIEENPIEAKKIISEKLGIDEKFIIHQKFQKNADVNLNSTEKWIEILNQRGDLKEPISINELIYIP